MRAFCGAISLVVQGLLLVFTALVACNTVGDCPASVHPLEGRCKIDCLSDNHCQRWQYCCKTGCWQTCANYTKCQLQKIKSSILRSPFTPTCKADGSYQEIQCITTPSLKCWRVDQEGRKIQDVDVTIQHDAPIRQSDARVGQRIGRFFSMEDDEIEENDRTQGKTKCQRARERRLQRRKTRSTVFVPKCKANGQFRATQCHKRTKTCWCVYEDGTEIPETRVKKPERPNCKLISGDCGLRFSLYRKQSTRRSRRVVGGRQSVANSWPWMVALFFNKTNFRCGGSIIKPSWIITAAHCFSDSTSKNPADWTVRVGEHSFKSKEEKEKRLGVRQIIIHPGYKRSNSSHPGDNDIALVHLSSSIRFGSLVNQICLPPSFAYFKPGLRCTVTGWGHTSWNGTMSHVLREGWIDLVSKPVCNSERSYNGTIGPNFLCAGFKEGRTDACLYDSGGPLNCPEPNGRWILAGIVSWGERCALPHKYGVYTNVHRYTPWITETLKLDR